MKSLKIPKDSFFENLDNILSFGKPSRDIALDHVSQKRTVIDIGAHVGISVIHWANQFNAVYAYEPMKEHYECLVENTKEFSNVTCFNFAISNKSSTSEAAYRTTKNSGSFQLLDESYKQPSKKSPRTTYTVETKKLDEFTFENVDLIKIDVEGWELEVLLGAEKTILEHLPVLIVEFTGGNSKKSLHTYDVNKYYDFINRIGYVPVGEYDDDIIYVKEQK